MAYRVTYWGLIFLVTAGLFYVYINRFSIPLTRGFESLLDEKIVKIEKSRKDLALRIVNLKIEQNQETSLRETAKSNTYSNPFIALNLEWYKAKIYYLNFLHFIFTYRIIFYILFSILILYMIREVFWKYYAL